MRLSSVHFDLALPAALLGACGGADSLVEQRGEGALTAASDCVSIDSLPMQQVAGNERIVHLGQGPGWAGRAVRLCPREEPVRRVRFKVRESGVTLDCNGVVLDGSGADGHAPVSRALDVDRGRLGMRAVTIRACTFIGYAQGLLLTGPNISDADPARALRRFVVEDTSVIDVGGVGVYVGPRSEDFVIERLVVRNARLTGLYLDAYSRRTRVADSRFEHNGYSRCSLGREGIAIDASSENVIERSVFIDNRLAGIAIYKNCGESGVPREQPASFNYIARNTFAAHCSAGGGAVVIASRQGVDIVADDCLADECLDPPMLDGRRRDHAPFNTVVFNRFLDNDTAVLVQDSHARVVGNSVAGAGCTGESTRAHIVVGSEFLSRVGAPVRDVSVLLNDATGDRPLLQIVDGSEEIDVGPRVSDGAGPAVAPGTRPVAD